jgi:GT2 family glycosyltransferase
MSYSIVTIGYKSLKNIQTCINQAFSSTKPPDEFIVIINPYDHLESSKILDYVQKDSRITRWAYMSQNVGVATAWNLGMAMSTKEHIVVLNDDCQVGPTTYEKMINKFHNDKVGIVGVLWGGEPEDPAPSPQGFLLAFRKSMIQKIGGYSEYASPLADERELSMRALANGYTLEVAEGCQWHHIHDISNNVHTVIKYLGSEWIPIKDQKKTIEQLDSIIKLHGLKIIN